MPQDSGEKIQNIYLNAHLKRRKIIWYFPIKEMSKKVDTNGRTEELEERKEK